MKIITPRRAAIVFALYVFGMIAAPATNALADVTHDGYHPDHRGSVSQGETRSVDKGAVLGGVESAGASTLYSDGNKFSPTPFCPGVLADTDALDGFGVTSMCP